MSPTYMRTEGCSYACNGAKSPVEIIRNWLDKYLDFILTEAFFMAAERINILYRIFPESLYMLNIDLNIL